MPPRELMDAIAQAGRQFQHALVKRKQGDNVIQFWDDLLSDCPEHFVVLYLEECLATAMGPGVKAHSSSADLEPGFQQYAAAIIEAATAGFNGDLRAAVARVTDFFATQDPTKYGANALDGEVSLQVLPGPRVGRQTVTAILLFRGPSGLAWSQQWVEAWRSDGHERCDACGAGLHTDTSCSVLRLAFPGGSTTLLDRIPYGSGIRAEEDAVFAEETGGLVPPACPDCGVPTGGIHHFPCDREECPSCSLKVLLCSCFEEGPVSKDVRAQHLANQRDILQRQRGTTRAFGRFLRRKRRS